MLTGRQCANASTIGRTALGDFATHSSHTHLLRLPVQHLCKRLHRRCCLHSASLQRCASVPKGHRDAQRHAQGRCWQRIGTRCAASGSCTEPSDHGTPNRNRQICTAALLTVAFGIWCCVSTRAQSVPAFLSMTAAVTGAGASSAGT